MHQWTGSVFVKLMSCCLLDTKPLSQPMLPYCQLDPQEQTSVKFESKYKLFHSWKCIWKCHLRNGSHVFQGQISDEMTTDAIESYSHMKNLSANEWHCNSLEIILSNTFSLMRQTFQESWCALIRYYSSGWVTLPWQLGPILLIPDSKFHGANMGPIWGR